MNTRQAFTLIELLIVVAIIAILAAIAVPNFMEAQMRAKVSRSRADMRSITTALEAYAVDTNHYPVIVGMASPKSWLVPLTTPTAFMTSLPHYPWKAWEVSWPYAHSVDYYYYNSYESFVSEEPGTLPWNIWDAAGGSKWYLSAAGPDGDYDQDWLNVPGGNNNPYDATNGTTSNGDLIRVGP